MRGRDFLRADRKSTRLNSSHQIISYAVFCLKKKKIEASEERRANSRQERTIHTDLGNASVRDAADLCRAVAGKPGAGRNLVFFFFNDTATTEIYTLSLHDALPI